MGAATGRLARAAELRSLLLSGAVVYGAGCAAAAAAPNMAVFLVGRLVQGYGGGLLLSLSYIAVQRLFPERLWTVLLAIASAVWGAASLIGPLIGGVFADLGSWCGAARSARSRHRQRSCAWQRSDCLATDRPRPHRPWVAAGRRC